MADLYVVVNDKKIVCAVNGGSFQTHTGESCPPEGSYVNVVGHGVSKLTCHCKTVMLDNGHTILTDRISPVKKDDAGCSEDFKSFIKTIIRQPENA